MNRFLAVTLAAAIGLTFAAAFVSADSKKKKDAPEISIDNLKQALEEKKVTVIDVNGTDSYKSGHIPTAIDYEAEKEAIKEKLPADKDALIVAYCGGPQCGAYKAATKVALDLGYTNVKHLKAGISGWKDAGEKTEKAS